MPRPTLEQLRKIIAKDKLDVDVVAPPKRRRKPRPEAGTPDLAALKKQFLGDDAGADDVGIAGFDDEDLGSFEVEHRGGTDDEARTPRTTVMSGSLGKPIAEQG
jgi:hypothetical protein